MTPGAQALLKRLIHQSIQRHAQTRLLSDLVEAVTLELQGDMLHAWNMQQRGEELSQDERDLFGAYHEGTVTNAMIERLARQQIHENWRADADTPGTA